MKAGNLDRSDEKRQVVQMMKEAAFPLLEGLREIEDLRARFKEITAEAVKVLTQRLATEIKRQENVKASLATARDEGELLRRQEQDLAEERGVLVETCCNIQPNRSLAKDIESFSSLHSEYETAKQQYGVLLNLLDNYEGITYSRMSELEPTKLYVSMKDSSLRVVEGLPREGSCSDVISFWDLIDQR
jgi:phage gp36-like protein